MARCCGSDGGSGGGNSTNRSSGIGCANMSGSGGDYKRRKRS